MMAQMRESGIDPMGGLRALGYEFREGRLLQVGSDSSFVFKTQEHYDALADAVLDYVGLLLEHEAMLEPIWLPLGAEAGSGCCIHASRGYETASKLLLIIQGEGRVRPGVWGCALCINKDLDCGSMLPHLRRAASSGYGVIVLNPNQRLTEDGRKVEGSESPEKHIAYVWEHLVVGRCVARGVDIIAHSAGGRNLLSFLCRGAGGDAGGRGERLGSAGQMALEAVGRLRRVVFTDSYHSAGQVAALPACARALLKDKRRAVNFVPHPASLGTEVDVWISQGIHRMTREEKGCRCVSAGTHDHASTNYASIDLQFEFFEADEAVGADDPRDANAALAATDGTAADAGAEAPAEKNGQAGSGRSPLCAGCLFPRRRRTAAQ